MTASELLLKHEDFNEYHFHEVDRKWIIEAMKEYAASVRDEDIEYESMWLGGVGKSYFTMGAQWYRSQLACVLFMLMFGSASAQKLDYNSLAHLGAGMAAGNIAALAKEKRLFYGAAAGFVLGMGKEIYDSQKGNGHFADVVMTTIGGLGGAMIVNLITNENKQKHCKPKRRTRANKRGVQRDGGDKEKDSGQVGERGQDSGAEVCEGHHR